MTRAWLALSAGLALTPVAQAQAPALGGLNGDGVKPIGIEAENGIEWQQNNHVYIARGHATATRGEDKVTADTLKAFYRADETRPPAAETAGGDPLAGGSTQIYRLEAHGHVVFSNPSETMTGDDGVYDVDGAVLVITGKGLRIVTPRDTITARDSLEWYDQKQLGVARGNAVALRGDRRVRGDVLTARVAKQANGQSRISRIDANGNVLVSSPGQIARGDAGVYNLDTGIATLTGHVRLTRGENELRGRYAVVDLNTNVSRLLSAPPGTPRGARRASRPEAHAGAAGGAAGSKAPHRPAARNSARTASAAIGACRDLPAAPRRRQYRPRRRQSRQELSPAPGAALGQHLGARGEAVGLLGPNGAGKTTCFYIITGLIRPDLGTITLDGEDITDLPMYRRARLGIGYLPQEAVDLSRPHRRAEPARRARGGRAGSATRARQMLDELLAEFSISHLRRAPALALSGGERRRVEIARALASQPHFILLDEPLAGIDPIAVGEIRDLVAHLKDRGIGVLITDHNVRETLEIVDRAYILHEGRAMEGAPDEIVNDADVRRVYLGERFSL